MSDTAPREKRFWNDDGTPDLMEHAMAALMNAHGSPQREDGLRWMRAAQVNAQLASICAMQDLAASNRQLAESQQAMVDEMRARRGA